MSPLKKFLRKFFAAVGMMQEPDLSMKPCTPQELQKRLKKGKVTFFFKKKNGELRMAQGTLKMKYVPVEKHPQGLREPSPKVVNFFDIVKKDWRCVSVNEEIFLQP